MSSCALLYLEGPAPSRLKTFQCFSYATNGGIAHCAEAFVDNIEPITTLVHQGESSSIKKRREPSILVGERADAGTELPEGGGFNVGSKQ